MQTDSILSSNSETHLLSETIIAHVGDQGIAASTPDRVIEPLPAKRPTRQWAAWTREEEESFFTALRQVGKNFEKITCHVQSKNKDQVRHYYYRLVRRMNKLLAPGLCLDAKNSKDTNAAMLRWWSLLEKYSCKASKLHLKPRRFKIFVEALEHQLLKDRKKTVRKRPLQGENCPPPMPNAVSNQSRALGHDGRAVKLVLVDTQNIPKLGHRKTASRCNVNVGINRGNNGGYPTVLKPSRPRRKSEGVSSAAYKKWEKAAIAGVSLVADAAEHLERTITNRDVLHNQNTVGEKNSDPAGSPLLLLAPLQPNSLIDVANTKLKLQLFPVDDGTRRALELDKHNPHLELTLSTRKKISSVLEHLSRKWGNSSAAHGALMLFPYSMQKKCLAECQRWTQDSFESAGDVYAAIGRPQVFRLRYGWCSNTEHGSPELQTSVPAYCIQDDHIIDARDIDGRIVDLASINDQPVGLNKDEVGTLNDNMSTPTVPNETERFICGRLDDLPRSSDPTLNISWDKKDVADRTFIRRSDDVDDLKLSNETSLSAGEWADSLTNINIGDLLSGVSQDVDPNCIDTPLAEGIQCLQQIPFSCDSFDAAIAAHISRQQDKTVSQPTLASHVSSIWDAEETCDAFSFQKNPVILQEVPSSSPFSSLQGYKHIARTYSMESSHMAEELLSDSPPEDHNQGDPMDECQSDPQISETKDLNELADIYWPDSLGPLDLDLPSTNKYHSEDLILGDSLSSLNRLIASSLDAFQNCSFFGLDKKESSTFNS
ncbi:TSL-kinase interacting protein 1 isoform X1 [Cucurbita pepo subsp. pepo]|uniref:TSL-kinase interacting protein 1 isoform X1 n=1 Tax=Cucurbita pepo subsp. pepo TaxID=3664 RepID=UPI000C9D7187|nr:TSL-kinase interacting protein 1 isoform X1 [Cucurbita pepo subsp. pepo]XP_023540576.1 TSL-kinase interacting protein 1 isoform X1 [Cucurbita pepo subsp. pepo]XP_023540577.1 TSL-kinase interacting protein 1 isoform X1 [Cucurbita pepo subsp. pepo]XP_023540579.1 TSL-kinase interacting protein 1 isoform X1 [Cucurbita pepo subsp. pepo]